jgi:hypothetical protein
VHDLQPLNTVTIHNAAVPLFVDQFVEGMAMHACYSLLDLFIGYDHCALNVSLHDHCVLNISSHDLTSFQMPLGTFHYTILPQGSTNAVAIFHDDVTFILEPEIPSVAKPFLNNTTIQGPASQYETPNRGYEMIPKNTSIQHFIWEHLNNVHQAIHCLGHTGTTVSAPKLFLTAPEVLILSHKCTYEGHILDNSKMAKIQSCPPCKTVTDVHTFLGTAGTMRIWIKNYSAIAHPLINLTWKNVEFTWEEWHDKAMVALKDAIASSPTLIPIDYASPCPVYLAIDSSWHAVGWILSQDCEDGQ